MKKIGTLLILVFLLIVAGCGNNEKNVEKEKSASTTVSKDTTEENDKSAENKKETEEEVYNKTGVYKDDYLGKIQTIGVGYNNDVGIDGKDTPSKPLEFGAMKLYITHLEISKIYTTDESKADFDNKDTAYALIVDMKAENTSNDDISFYPNQSIITTDVGEQIEDIPLYSGDVGGDFLGKVSKEGRVLWILNKDPEKIKKIKLIISAPTDKNLDDIGKEIRTEFNILSWDESVKKDNLN